VKVVKDKRQPGCVRWLRLSRCVIGLRAVLLMADACPRSKRPAAPSCVRRTPRRICGGNKAIAKASLCSLPHPEQGRKSLLPGQNQDGLRRMRQARPPVSSVAAQPSAPPCPQVLAALHRAQGFEGARSAAPGSSPASRRHTRRCSPQWLPQPIKLHPGCCDNGQQWARSDPFCRAPFSRNLSQRTSS